MAENKPVITVDEKFDQKDIDENKVFACLSYIGILCLIPLLAKKDSKFAVAHAKQGLALLIVDVVVAAVSWIPIIGWLLAVLVCIVSIIGIINALQGKLWRIPVLFDLSKKWNL